MEMERASRQEHSYLPTFDHCQAGGGIRSVKGLRNGDQVLTTRVGLRFPPATTFEQWAETGPKLSRLVDAFSWCLGDWLVYGQEKYDKRYIEAIDKVGLDYQTLRNYAWISRKFQTARRRESLSFQHHAEVAALLPSEQESWLDRAEEHGWSKAKLRLKIREARREGQLGGSARPALPRLRVEEDRLENWRVAAAQKGADLASWIIDTLDREATRTLDSETGDLGRPTP